MIIYIYVFVKSKDVSVLSLTTNAVHMISSLHIGLTVAGTLKSVGYDLFRRKQMKVGDYHSNMHGFSTELFLHLKNSAQQE